MMSEQADWMSLLQQATAEASTRSVAEKLGYSPTAVSLVLSGKYKGKTDRIAARVLEVYAVTHCPHRAAEITLEICKQTAFGKAPTHNPGKMAQWRACQKCPKRPEN